MTPTSSEASLHRAQVATFRTSLAALAGEIATLAEQAEELERLGTAIVENANGDAQTVVLTTSLVDDMSACIERIKAHRS